MLNFSDRNLSLAWDGDTSMKDFTTYLSTAPVLAALWFGLLAGLLIEVNRFYPDALTLSFV